MTSAKVRTLGVAALAVLTLLPTLVSRMSAPANYGAQELTTGFGRGRLDFRGIVSEGSGGSVDLPNEPLTLSLRLSGAAPVRLQARGVDRTIVASDVPGSIRMELPQGGPVSIESASRIRLHDLVVERVNPSFGQAGLLAVLGVLGVVFATRGLRQALTSALLLLLAFMVVVAGTLSLTFTRIALAELVPAIVILLLFAPLLLALKGARFPTPRNASRLSLVAFVGSLALTGVQLARFDQPLPMGDPASYLDMGDKYADAMMRAGSPLGFGPILTDLQAYLALPATGVLYGVLRLLSGGLGLIYATQAMAMAVAVSVVVSICETEIGPRAGRIALAMALLHPSFSILPGIVQPEPFILAVWTLGVLAALRAFRDGHDRRGYLGAGVLLGVGLALHPQGLSFLLLALALCVLPWIFRMAKAPRLVLATVLGTASVLLPVAAAERFAKPLAYVLDKQYGFFAYTSPHPLGFWLYTDSDGWQGPLRIEDTTYQKELLVMKGETAVSSTFGDVLAFVSRHPAGSARALLTNLHRLWHQPDNPFAVPFVLPYAVQVAFHRALLVLFVLSLPALFGGRLAVVALPFAMLSMTYPAYHIFNKYATPALPFTIIGAALVVDRVLVERSRHRLVLAGLGCAAMGALLPATAFAEWGISGDVFLGVSRGLLWMGLGLALATAIHAWGVDRRSRLLAGVVGFTVLLASSFSATVTDTSRGSWSVSLREPFEVSCRVPQSPLLPASTTPEPAWILIDAQAADAKPPRIEVNGQRLETATPTMPTFGLATVRGHRDPATFRQIWRAPMSEQLLAQGDLKIRVSGSSETEVFGDIRSGSEGPRLSIGNWPYLSVYRLMHEGEYRLPTTDMPAQACAAPKISGRPGIALARIKAGEENEIALKASKSPTWVF